MNEKYELIVTSFSPRRILKSGCADGFTLVLRHVNGDLATQIGNGYVCRMYIPAPCDVAWAGSTIPEDVLQAEYAAGNLRYEHLQALWRVGALGN